MTGPGPGPPSLRHHGHAWAPRPNRLPGWPTISLPSPNGGRPLPHQRVVRRPHHRHPGRVPVRPAPAGALRLTILNFPPNPPGDAVGGLPPPLKMPSLQDKQAWSQYNRAIDRALRNQRDPTDLLTAMRTAAVTREPQAEDGQPTTALEICSMPSDTLPPFCTPTPRNPATGCVNGV